MTEFILDASAILAVSQNEPGKEKVAKIIERSAVGRINHTETLTSLINKGTTLSDAIAAFESLELRVIEFDIFQSEKTAELRPITKHLGLSLGDRACLALAIQENAVAVTSDRNWTKLDICQIESIR